MYRLFNYVVTYGVNSRHLYESLMLFNKSVFLEFMNKEDEQTYKEFSSFAALWVHHYE